MAEILRYVQTECGSQPQVGRFFRVHGTDSIATFFTAVNDSQGDEPLAGMVIVSQVSGDHMEGALLIDNAQRLGGTIDRMLGELFKIWPPGSASQGVAPVVADAPAAPLKQYVLPDRSATVSLPDGWQVSPTSGYGTIIASGPSGEAVRLDDGFRAANSSDPRVQRTMAFAEGAGRNTTYAQVLYYPYGLDMAKTFVDMIQMAREKQGMQPALFQITSETKLPSAPGWRRTHITGRMDAGQGLGMEEINDVFCCSPLGPRGGYMTYIYASAVPVRLADQERATIVAILSSFRADQRLVAAQAGAIAAPEIARIHEIGRQVTARIASTHAQEDAHNAAIERQWANEDKQSEGFTNYLLDQSVIKDNETGTSSTEWNQKADALVHADPGRYEYVTP